MDAGKIEDDYALFESPEVCQWLWSNKAEAFIGKINAKLNAAEEEKFNKEHAIEQEKTDLTEEKRKQKAKERAARAEKESAENAALQQIVERIKSGEDLSCPYQIIGNTIGIGNVCPKEKAPVSMVFHNPKCTTCQYCAYIELSRTHDKYRTWCFFPIIINPNNKQNYRITDEITR